MAANLAGMFGQLNQAIGQNPMAQGGVGDGLLNMASRGMGSAVGNAVGGNPYDFMNQGAKELQGTRDMKKLDLQTSQGLNSAAKIALETGDEAKAMQYTSAAKLVKKTEDEKKSNKLLGAAFRSNDPKKMTEIAEQLMAEGRMKEAEILVKRSQAVQAKQNATLEAGNQGIQEQAMRTKKDAQKTQAVALAKRNADKDAVSGLQAGTISPEAYMTGLLNAKDKNQTVADGASLVGPDGKVLYNNPKDTTGAPLTATMQKRVNATNDSYRENESVANEMDGLLSQLDNSSLSAGWFQSADTFLNNATGRRDDDDYLRTQFIGLKNGEAIKALPKGPASDKDIFIVMKGFPADNAGPEEIRRFVEAYGNTARRAMVYERAKADFIEANGDENGFLRAWEPIAARMQYQEYVDEIPDAAIERLMANPTPAERAWFQAEFKVSAADFLPKETP